MAYELTFTPRSQKHFRKLTTREKSQLKIKLELLAKNPSHPSLRKNVFRVPLICLSVALTWISVLSGIMKATK